MVRRAAVRPPAARDGFRPYCAGASLPLVSGTGAPMFHPVEGDAAEASLLIAAPRADVAAVIADLAAYPAWNAEIPDVDVLGSDPEGRPRQARLVLASAMLRDELVLDYEWWWPERVAWRLARPGRSVCSMAGSYTLREDADGRHTTVTYRLSVELTVALIAPLRRKAERVVIERALVGLQQRVEQQRVHEQRVRTLEEEQWD